MSSGGYNKKDKELINKGYTTIHSMAKEFGRNRCSIETVLKYLYIEPSETIGTHLFYTQSDKEQVEQFYNEHKDDFNKFLAKEMRIRKNGGNGYTQERSDKIHETKLEKYGENYGRLAFEKGQETCEELYGDKNYRNVNKLKNTLNENRLKFCEENDCSLFTEIFGTSVEHNRKTLDFCMDNLGIKLINYKTVLYIKNEDIPRLQNELNKVRYNHTSMGEKEVAEFIKNLVHSDEKFKEIYTIGYRTLNEILKENNISDSKIKSIRKYTEFLEKINVYHPKARKNVDMYSPTVAEEIIKFANLSKSEKSKVICELTYGVEHPSQLEENRKLLSEINKANSKERTIKRNKTNLERYGTSNFINSDKAKKTIIENYGSIENYNIEMGKRRKERFEINSLNFCKENDCTMFCKLYEPSVKHLNETLDWCIKQANIKLLMFENVPYIRNCDIPLMDAELEKIKKNYSHVSKGEKSVCDFISSFEFEIIENDRSIIYPKELDIYIPSKNVAIEYDGLHYHSSQFVEKDYHLNKTLACKEKGIRLIHIFEDEWLYKRPIVESIISSALGIYKQKIFARKCEVKEIDNNTFRQFCNENHIQGECNSSERLGLFYNGELVQAVGFCKSRFTKNENELVRMVTKLNTQVVGGFSRLMKHYGKDCISYIDYRLFNGDGYKASGFEYVQTNRPNYYYTKEFDRYYRMNFTKKNIAKKFPNDYDPNLTEEQNMEKLGFYKIYDCGTIKVKYKVNNL